MDGVPSKTYTGFVHNFIILHSSVGSPRVARATEKSVEEYASKNEYNPP